MKVNHTWNAKERTVPKLVPIQQVEAAVKIAAQNAMAVTIQMCQEHMILMLNDVYGFGRERCMKALEAFQKQMTEWQKSIDEEFDSETFRLNCKQKQTARPELAWTWENHDRKLKPLIDPKVWKPYEERYKGYGGRGAWCK